MHSYMAVVRAALLASDPSKQRILAAMVSRVSKNRLREHLRQVNPADRSQQSYTNAFRSIALSHFNQLLGHTRVGGTFAVV